MNTTVASEVREFLDVVTAQLADVPDDDRHEILDGLEADLNDLVAEKGPEALGDPKAYAQELRQAAGLTATSGAKSRRLVREATTGFLDACHARWDALVERLPDGAAPVVAWLRPLWWITRAWAAFELVAMIVGLGGVLGGFGLALAVVGSIALGLGKFWPGGERGLFARLVLIALNAFAVAVAVAALSQLSANRGAFQSGYDQAVADMDTGEKAGIYANGKWISNIYPYTADGMPVSGIQLFDQDGKPINIVIAPECVHADQVDENGKPMIDRISPDDVGSGVSCSDPLAAKVYYPWTNGATQLFNVFPLTSRMQSDVMPSATAFDDEDAPTVGLFPLLRIPSASLPGVEPGVVVPKQ